MPDHHNALPPGYRLGEYEIQTVLGSGGFGVTYKAHDHNLDKSVAIKEYLPPEFAVRDGRTTVKPKSSASKDDYEWGLARFLDEARTLARFDHPHINKVHRFFKENGTAYLVLEYVDGDMLSDLLKRKGRFNEAGVRRMLDELLDGLDKVHSAGYIHRDIKPANIIFRRDGSAVLLDFGAARQAIGQRSQMITSILTRGYAPVEQYLDTVDAMGAWSDLYSLGVVAYRCLIGGDESVLIDAPSRAHLLRKGETEKDMPPAVKIGKDKYSASLLSAIDWAMKVEESDRPQSVAEMRAALAGEAAKQSTHKLKRAATLRWASARKALKQVRASEVVASAKKAMPKLFAFAKRMLLKIFIAMFVVATVIALFLRIAFDNHVTQQIARQQIGESSTPTESRSRQNLASEHVAFRNLVGRGASARRVDKDGATDLHIAAARGWAELAQWLIDDGADARAQFKTDDKALSDRLKTRLGVRCGGRQGQRPIHFAASKNSIDAVKLLLANGANVNAKTIGDFTPLHFAAFYDAVDSAKLLIANGANVNAKDDDGNTPLHMTAFGNAANAAKLLIANGANVNAKDDAGFTPLDWAIYEKHSAIQSLLKQHGGQCNKRCQ